MKTKITNCLSAGIRKRIDCPGNDSTILRTLSAGETIEIDKNTVGYDWKDRKFYKCTSPVDGWICAELVKV